MAVVTIYSEGDLQYVVLPSREVLSKHPDGIAVSITNSEQSSFWLNETRKRTIQEEGTQFFKQHADKLDTSLSMEDADGKMSDGFFLYLAFRRFQNQQNQSYFINDDDVGNLLKPDPTTKKNGDLTKLLTLDTALTYLSKATAEDEHREYDPEGFHEGPRHGHYFRPGEREVGGREIDIVQAPEAETSQEHDDKIRAEVRQEQQDAHKVLMDSEPVRTNVEFAQKVLDGMPDLGVGEGQEDEDDRDGSLNFINESFDLLQETFNKALSSLTQYTAGMPIIADGNVTEFNRESKGFDFIFGEDGKIKSFAFSRLVKTAMHDDPVYTIAKVVVSPDIHKKEHSNYGTKLMMRLIHNFITESDATLCSTHPLNERVGRYYRKFGFFETATGYFISKETAKESFNKYARHFGMDIIKQQDKDFQELIDLENEVGVLANNKDISWGSKSTENLSKSIPVDDSIRIGNLNIPIEVATDPVVGLSGRDSLVPGTGMLFIFDKSPVITMKGMKFPLDIVWMADGRVVDVTENALVPVLYQSPVYIPKEYATVALEINGGEVQRLGIKIGDFVVGDNLLCKQSNLSKLLVLETALEHLLKMKPGETPEYGAAPPNTPAYKGKRGGSFYYPSEVGTFTSVEDAAKEDIPIGEEIEREVISAKDAGGMVPWKSYAEMLPSITKEEVSKQLKDAKREGWPGVRDKTPVTPGVVMRDDEGNITSISTPDGHMISVKEVDPKEPDRGGKSGLVIARTADAEVQAQWVDSQGRKQGTYSFEHAKEAEGKKAAEVADLVEVLPALEKALKRDMKNPKPLGKMRLSTIREAAFTVALIHDTFRRVGGAAGATLVTMDGKNGKPKKMDKDGKPIKEYVKTYGITTILGKHAKVVGNKVTLDFLGKKGVRNVVTVSDSSLAKELIRRKKEGGPNRTLLNITSSTVNAYLKRVSGRDLTAKNFRTYHGTRLGLEALDAVGKIPSIKKSTFEVDMVKLVSTIQKKGGKDLTADEWRDAIELYVIDAHTKFKVNLIGEPVSKRLGNEPSMALNSYISNAIFEQDWDPSFATEMEKLMDIPRFSARKVASIQVKIKEQAAAARIKKKEAGAKLAQQP